MEAATNFILVYNCRTSNAWDLDLAYTSTYFPHCGLTFAVLFGCTLSIESEVLRRLGSGRLGLGLSGAEAAHPLLVPGIMVELERSRHIEIVEATIDHLESKIFELNGSSKVQDLLESETEKRNEEKRSSWLNTTYLRNGLISWNTQLAKIAKHSEALRNIVSELADTDSQTISGEHTGPPNEFVRIARRDRDNSYDTLDENSDGSVLSLDSGKGYVNMESETTNEVKSTGSCHELIPTGKAYDTTAGSLVSVGQFMRVGHKISDRIQSIIDEYDDKIRDCSMRVDGMAMATQWV
jgi:hypothetical protein